MINAVNSLQQSAVQNKIIVSRSKLAPTNNVSFGEVRQNSPLAYVLYASLFAGVFGCIDNVMRNSNLCKLCLFNSTATDKFLTFGGFAIAAAILIGSTIIDIASLFNRKKS